MYNLNPSSYLKYTFGSILLEEMDTSLENKNKGEISASDILRMKLLTPVVCNSISHPSAPPADQQHVPLGPGRSFAALTLATREHAHSSAALARGAHRVSRGNTNTSTGSACLSSPSCSLPPMASRAPSVLTWGLGRLECGLDKEGIKSCVFSLFSECFQMSHMFCVDRAQYQQAGSGCPPRRSVCR